LDGAVAFAQVNDAALVVTQNLDFDMVGVFDVLLDVNPGVAEGLFGLGAGGMIAFDEGDIVMGDAHAAAAAAGDGFDHHGIPDAFGDGQGVLFLFHHALGARRGFHAGLFGQGAADGLVLERLHGAGAGADEADVAAFTNLGEMGVFRKEPIARVDGVHIGDFGGADDAVNAQVTFGGRGFADADGLIGQLHMHGVDVGLGIDGHGFDIQFLAGPNDPDGDFAAIGYKNFLKHDNSMNQTSDGRMDGNRLSRTGFDR